MLLWKKNMSWRIWEKKTCSAVQKHHHVTVQVGIFGNTNWCCSKLVLTPEIILLIPFVFKHTLGPDICESFATSPFLSGSIKPGDKIMGVGGIWGWHKATAPQPLYDFDEWGKCHMFRSKFLKIPQKVNHNSSKSRRTWWNMSHVQILPGSCWLLGASARSWWKTWWHGAPSYSQGSLAFCWQLMVIPPCLEFQTQWVYWQWIYINSWTDDHLVISVHDISHYV